jgi:hypothetical protein
MTRDDDLIDEITRLIACKDLINDLERATVEEEIKYYKLSCKLSNGADRGRNVDWTKKARTSKGKLESIFRVLTGRDYFDMRRFQRCDKCE